MLKITLIFFILCISSSLHSKTICITPLYHKLEPFINPIENLKTNVSDVYLEIVFFRLKEALENAGYEIKFILPGDFKENTRKCKKAKAILVFNNYTLELLETFAPYKNKTFLFVFEPPLVMQKSYDGVMKNYFDKIFVMLENIIDNKNYFKFFYPQPRLKMIANVRDFNDKKLCTLISANILKLHRNSLELYSGFLSNPKCLYAEREKVISFFENLHPNEFDLYGYGWEGRKSWKGTISDKWVILNKYKFCICYENSKDQPGYITEKIFDCFNGGCVPVYWGASNILNYVPKECFIDRRLFSSDEELYYYLKNMDRVTYERYLVAILHYLESPQAKLFSLDNFINIIMNNISQKNYAKR